MTIDIAIFVALIYRPSTLGQKSTFYPKIHTLKIPIFTRIGVQARS